MPGRLGLWGRSLELVVHASFFSCDSCLFYSDILAEIIKHREYLDKAFSENSAFSHIYKSNVLA